MKNLAWIAPVVAAAGLAGFAATFVLERGAFRSAVVGWARRDLKVRAQLAASTLRESLATSDFRRIHEFGDGCDADGVRLTVLGRGGGVFFDTLRRGAAGPESIYESAPCGEFEVRLGLPVERVLAPFNRANLGFILAGLVGAAGVFLVFFATYTQSVRIREYKRLEKFRREFIADFSHEIRTPLAAIMGSVDILGTCGESERGAYIEMAMKGTKRLAALAQDILDLSRLERPGMSIQAFPNDPDDFVKTSVKELLPLAREKGVRLAVPPGRGGGRPLRPVEIDAELMFRALSNLVGNALRHSGSPEVLVWAEETARETRFVVEDCGKGIPPELASNVFERFSRVDKSRSAATGGAGLGLAIVRQIARLHGGDVSLEPVAPHGCRFAISIPSK